jgi:molybdopterin converting factor small subunit
MPRVVFTSHLQRHVKCADMAVNAATLRATLDAVFAQQPQVRDYVLDEQGHLRKHVFVFIDGARLREREHLDVPVREASEIYVMQALTGG